MYNNNNNCVLQFLMIFGGNKKPIKHNIIVGNFGKVSNLAIWQTKKITKID